jgi:hypothetical protein
MKRNLRNVIFVLFIFISTISFSQEAYKRTVGLTTSFHQGDFGIQIPFWVDQRTTIAPYFSVKSISEAGTDFAVGVIPKMYISMDKLAPYVGIKLGAVFYNPPDGSTSENTTDFFGGFAFGGDYFLDPRFCIGVEAQLNLAVSDENSSRFGNPGGNNFNTGMAINASIFFGK